MARLKLSCKRGGLLMAAMASIPPLRPSISVVKTPNTNLTKAVQCGNATHSRCFLGEVLQLETGIS
jgi:hypothetical protein